MQHIQEVLNHFFLEEVNVKIYACNIQVDSRHRALIFGKKLKNKDNMGTTEMNLA